PARPCRSQPPAWDSPIDSSSYDRNPATRRDKHAPSALEEWHRRVVHIRPRTEADLDGCEALVAVVRAVDGYPPHLPHQLRQFVASPDAVAAWVAEADGEIVGHVVLNRTTSEEVMALACAVLDRPAESLVVVARLFVAPPYRRAGTGGRLLQAATT